MRWLLWLSPLCGRALFVSRLSICWAMLFFIITHKSIMLAYVLFRKLNAISWERERSELKKRAQQNNINTSHEDLARAVHHSFTVNRIILRLIVTHTMQAKQKHKSFDEKAGNHLPFITSTMVVAIGIEIISRPGVGAFHHILFRPYFSLFLFSLVPPEKMTMKNATTYWLIWNWFEFRFERRLHWIFDECGKLSA